MSGHTVAEEQIRSSVLELNGGRCAICNRAPVASYSHRLPASAGGPVSVANGLGLCGDGTRGCHGALESRPELAYATGWKVRRGDDPVKVPALAYIDLQEGWWRPVPDAGAWELCGTFPRGMFRHGLDVAVHLLRHLSPGEYQRAVVPSLPGRPIPDSLWPARVGQGRPRRWR